MTDYNPSLVLLSEIESLYDQGLYLRCYERLQDEPPPYRWRDPAWCVLGSRLAVFWGSSLLSRMLAVRAVRAAPADADAVHMYGVTLFSTRGPLACLDWCDATRVPDATAIQRAHLLALRANSLAVIRDFSRCDAALEQAQELAPQDLWVMLTAVHALEIKDRRDQALAQVARLVDSHPRYRPAIEVRARLLIDLGQTPMARTVLREAAAQMQCASFTALLALLAIEAGDLDEAEAALDRTAMLQPLARGASSSFLFAQRARLALAREDRMGAIRYARAAKKPLLDRLADRLDKVTTLSTPVRLPVPVERQAHLTCGPATLTALARFFGRADVEQTSVAQAICYGGTPSHKERAWCERNGFVAREFRVTVPATEALLSRGVPFALETRDVLSGHLQVVSGMDAAAGLLTLREPGSGLLSFADAQALEEAAGPWGPRGMAIVPADRASLIADLDLPEAEAYDHLYAVLAALAENDRARAVDEAAAVARAPAGQRLALWAQLHLAGYDGNAEAVLKTLDLFVQSYPEDPWVAWRRFLASAELEPAQERLALATRAATTKADPLFHLELARLLAEDARRQREAEWHLRRAVRGRPLAPEVLSVVADRLAERGADREAAGVRRAAACQRDTDEELAWAYALAARRAGEAQEGLAFLEERDRAGRSRSRAPALTCHRFLGLLDRDEQAKALLSELTQAFPSDPEVLRYVASSLLGTERQDQAAELLNRLAPKAHNADIARLRAQIEELAGRRDAAISILTRQLEAEPQSLDLHTHLCRLLADAEGPSAARTHAAAAVARFPHHFGLQQLCATWLREGDPQAALAALRRWLELHPNNTWAWRELAWTLLGIDRLEEAHAAATEATARDPESVSTHCLLGDIASRRGRVKEALAHYHAAQSRQPGFAPVIDRILELVHLPEEHEAELGRLESLLCTRFHDGDAVFTWYQHAAALLAPAAVLQGLERLHAALPGFWQVLVCRARQRANSGDLAGARTDADRLIDAWPGLPRVWLEQGEIAWRANALEAAEDSWRRAMMLAPYWHQPAQRMADLLLRTSRREAALEVADGLVRRDPRNAVCRGYRGDLLLRTGRREEGLNELERAIDLDPGYEWAWGTLANHDRHRAEAVARRHTRLRPGFADGWLRLANLSAGSSREQALDDCDRALARAPHHIEAHALKMRLLAELGRLDAALGEASREHWPQGVPVGLERQAAMILSRAGRRAEASARAKAAIERAPHDPRGFWTQVVVARVGGDVSDAIAALDQLERLTPNNANVFLERASLEKERGNPRAALAARRRALELDPADLGCAFSLLEELIEAGAWQEAETVLTATEARNTHPWLMAIRARLEGEAGHGRRVLELARALCDQPAAEAEMIGYAVCRSPARLAARLADQLIAHPPQGAAAAVLVAARLSERWPGRRLTRRRFLQAVAAKPAATPFEAAVVGELAAMGAKRGKSAGVLELVRRYGPAVRRHTHAWGRMGYALAQVDCMQELAAWSGDWRERPDAQGWMLLNAAAAHRSLGAWKEACEIHRHALASCADFRQAHGAWLAVAATLTNSPDEARQALSVAVAAGASDAEEFVSFPLALTGALEATDRDAARLALQKAREQPGAKLPVLEHAAAWLTRRHDVAESFFGVALNAPAGATATGSGFTWGLVIFAFLLLSALRHCGQ